MELIIKPTELCNFKCTFCSSTNLVEDKASLLDLDKIFTFLKRFPETNTIIVNGGDPLMVSPSYYWKIIKFLDDHNMDTSISFTSNLWDFYMRPDKWVELIKHPRMGVATSFNYGETRIITEGRVYTEDLFWKVSDLFLDRIGYRPDFISVINEDNEDTAIDNVLLAKKMGVECKLNYAMASGDETTPYQLSKIYEIYIQIADQGLTEWEYNTKQMVTRLTGVGTTCPQNRDCDSGIRCLQPEGDYYSCGAFGDDKEYPINFNDEMNSPEKIFPLKRELELNMLKDECLSCPMFEICNGCKKTVKDMKISGIVESHCSLMKKLSTRIQELNE
jgi:radical SAM protein with 4Fe4S-binding SPASM domain